LSLKDFINIHNHRIIGFQNHNFTTFINNRRIRNNNDFLVRVHLLFQANVLRDIYIGMIQYEQANNQLDVTQARLFVEFLLAHEILYFALLSDRAAMNLLDLLANYFQTHRFSSLTLQSHDELSRSLTTIVEMFQNNPPFNCQIYQCTVVIEELFRDFFRTLNGDHMPALNHVRNFWLFIANNHVDIFNMRCAYGEAAHVAFEPVFGELVQLETQRMP
jgi:hypothetical protein